MEACTKKHEVQNTKVVRRVLGNNFRLVQRIQRAASAKHAWRFDRRRRDDAAGQNEAFERYDEEHKIKKEGWMLTLDGGLLSCWRQTARKLGSI